ncbi:PilZ domain-containing protein [Bradyrhizobium sp. USDA 4486]
MVETRNAPRFRAAMPAQIDGAGDKISCTIRDISTSGAALQFLVRQTEYPPGSL